MSDEFKALGNKSFQERDFKKSILYFTQGIAVDPKNYVLYSNRAGAFSSLDMHLEALIDALTCIELNPDFIKGYNRAALPLRKLKLFNLAIQQYSAAMQKLGDNKTDANHMSIMSGFNECLTSFSTNPAQADTDAWAALVASPSSTIKSPTQLKRMLEDLATLKKNTKVGNDWSFDNSDALNNPDYLKELSSIAADSSKLLFLLNKKEFAILLHNILSTETSKTSQEKKEEQDEVSMEDTASKEQAAHEEEEMMEVDQEAVMLAKRKEEAFQLKNTGNDLYKKKDFENAIEHYSRAIELDGTNMSFYLNMAAAYFELAEHKAKEDPEAHKALIADSFEKCREYSETAVQVGREHRAGFVMLAKAFTRIANSHWRQKAYPEAIAYFKKSLSENRNRDTLDLLNKVEKEYTKAKKDAYYNPDLSLQEKEKGNEFFKKSQFPEAIKCYDEAIERNPNDPLLYSNRAAAYMKLGQFPTALSDCDKALKLEPTLVKAISRKGKCYIFLKEFAKANQMYEEILKIDPNNTEAREGMREVSIARMKAKQGMTEEQILEEAMKDPEVSQLMQDPSIRQILSELSTNPAAASEYLKNPEILNKINKLVEAGIIRTQ